MATKYMTQTSERRARKAKRELDCPDPSGSLFSPYPGWPAPGITCRCGHTENLEHFCVDGFGNDLPRNHYKCPSCNWQWSRVRIEAENEWSSPTIEIREVAVPVL